MTKRVRIGIVGLGFGAEFIPIYQAHPDAELVAVCQRSGDALLQIADEFEIERRYTRYEDMLEDDTLDAIHINTPIGLHADQSIAALEAGKHVACTVPMATSLEDCARVVDASARSGRSYMMMETAVYTREYLFVKHLVETGRLGRIQFLRGSHLQDMTGWPDYWMLLPPMHYATHAIAPLLSLASRDAVSVRGVGSGRNHSPSPANEWGFAVESALFQLHDSDLAIEVTRSLFDVARQYIESFDVYGEALSVEWQRLESEEPVLFTGERGERVRIPDFAHLLPGSIRAFTRRGVYDSSANQHLSFTQGSGHGGSHPHLAHEFVTSIIGNRSPYPDAAIAANWTSAGICAHESAMIGREVAVPRYSLPVAP